VFALCAVWFLARWLAGMPIGRLAFLSNLPLFVVPVFVVLVVSKTYMRVWSRAQVRDFAVLVMDVVAGTLMGLGLVWLFEETEPYVIRFAVLFGALSVFPLAGIRLWSDCVRGAMQMLERRILVEKPEAMRVLAYGGGLRFRSFLREMAERSGMNGRVIMGIVDDDLNLRGRLIAGYTVLGKGEELHELVREWKISGLIITSLLPPEKQSRVVALMNEMGIQVVVWACEEVLLTEPGRRPAEETKA